MLVPSCRWTMHFMLIVLAVWEVYWDLLPMSTRICCTGRHMPWRLQHVLDLTHLFRKYVSRRGPEARLYIACLVGLLLPSSMFIYAWTANPNIFWMWPVVGLTVCSWFCVVESAKQMIKPGRSSCFVHLFHSKWFSYIWQTGKYRYVFFLLACNSTLFTPKAMGQWHRLLWRVKA